MGHLPSSDATYENLPKLNIENVNDVDNNEVGNSDDDFSNTKKYKPPYPYYVGSTFKAQQHRPPTPCGYGYPKSFLRKSRDWQSLSQVEHCLSQNPLEGEVVQGIEKEIEVTAEIRIGTEYGAQIVLVNDTLVAKIFDPMYYTTWNGYGIRDNVVASADEGYSNEAAAYEALQSSLEVQQYIPKYYGSWTIEVTLPDGMETKAGNKLRNVRLILLEHIKGTPMDQIKPLEISQAARTNILKKIFEVDAIMFYAGINHNDISPRNIFCIGEDYSSLDLKVFIIDFNIAVVRYIAHPEHSQVGEKMLSPVYRWWGQTMEFSSRGWLPNDLDGAEKWLWETFGNDVRYMQVELKGVVPGKKRGHPKLIDDDDDENDEEEEEEEEEEEKRWEEKRTRNEVVSTMQWHTIELCRTERNGTD